MEKFISKDEFIRKAVVSISQLRYYLATGESELIYKIPLTTILSIEDIITIKGALNKIKFYGKGGLVVNDKINNYLVEMLENCCKKENFKIKVQIPTNKYGLNRKAWIAKLLCIQDLVCDKTDEVFEKRVYEDSYDRLAKEANEKYSENCIWETINYTKYSIKEQFKSLRIVTKQFEAVVVGTTYNIKSKVAGKTITKVVRSTPIGEQLHIPFEIDGVVYNKEKIKNFFRVQPTVEIPEEKSRYDIEKDIWTILNSIGYSYRDIMCDEMADKLVSKVFFKLLRKNLNNESNKLSYLFRESNYMDREKAVLIAYNYLLDLKEDVLQYFDTEAVAEIIEEMEDQSTVYFGKQNYFESEVYDDSNIEDVLDDEEEAYEEEDVE